MAQKEAIGKKKSKGDLVCSVCGCHMWLWDEGRHRWNGEYHFQDCSTVPGGGELFVRNLEEKAKWEEESFVPREKGLLILRAIKSLMVMPKGKDGKPTKEFLQRKEAIQEEIDKLALPNASEVKE